MKKKYFKSLPFAFTCGLCTFGVNAAVSLFSDYGQIQNVQNYSSSPFWSPNAPYNQRLPQPIYATGTDLNADDCIRVVQSLVSAQCMARNNCKSTDLSDIRPPVMVQLSNLPGANYVSSCSGYIDEIFESYKKQYGNTLPNRPTAFPNATVSNPDAGNSNGIQLKNPYKKQPTKWQNDQKERANELQRLQSQTGTGNEQLTQTDFPGTYADLSFSERMENDREGLIPYKDASAYRTLDVKSESEWCNEHSNDPKCQKQDDTPNPPQDNCSKYEENTNAYDCCMDTNGTWNETDQKCTCSGTLEWTPGEWKANGSGNRYWQHGQCNSVPNQEPNQEPNQDQNPPATEEDNYVYQLAIYTYRSGQAKANTNPNNRCYSVCGISMGGDDVNKKVLEGVIGSASYCVPQKVVAHGTDGCFGCTEFILQDSIDNHPIEFNMSQAKKIEELLHSIQDSGNCDWRPDVKAFILRYQKNDTNKKLEKTTEILLDD